MILLQLYWSFLQVGALSFGGAYAAMPLIQAQAVEGFSWLTMAEFGDLITIAEMTPGPIALNAATFVGTRIAGLPGALIATLGFLTPSLLILSLVALLLKKYSGTKAMDTILSCLRPAVVALIASAGLGILKNVVFPEGTLSLSSVEWLSLALFAAAFFALRKWKLNPIWVMLSCGGVNLILHLFL